MAQTTVTVYVDGSAIGSTTSGSTGSWALGQPTALAEGSHSVEAAATDSAGNVSPRSNRNTFTVDTVPVR